MIKRLCPLRRSLPSTALLLLAALAGMNHVVHGSEMLAQGAGVPTGPPAISPVSPMAPPEIVKPVPVSELGSAESVFDKLDRTHRGYVIREDTQELIGFEDAFSAAEVKGSGKLTLPQFRKAWAIYKRK
jgi:hypothetical protein